MSAKLRSPLPWLGALLAIYMIVPIVAFAIRLTGGVSSAPGLGAALVTSVLTATISTAIIVVLGVPLAYLLAHAPTRIATPLSALVALPLALPPLMSGILLLYLVGPYTVLGRVFGGNLTDTATGIVIAQTFVAAPFLVIAARAAFESVPADLDEVARTLGHRTLARFLKVALPVARPGVQAGLLLAWLRAFGEFGATVILAYHPYSLPVYTFVQFDSTGLAGTMLPVAVALGAALVVLIATQARLGGGGRRPDLPAASAPPQANGSTLEFSVRKCLGAFRLTVANQAGTKRLALLGASGAGKTLTLRVLAGITDAECADIRAGMTELGKLAPEDRRIGYLPQNSALLPGRTVWEQIVFAPDADHAGAAWWLERLGLAGLEDRLPRELSGGEQRRVALARALSRNAGLTLLDEPFSALDAPVRARLCRELRRLQREVGLTTVLATHDPEEAALLSDELIILDRGSVLQQGPTADVLAQPASARVAALLGVANTYAGQVLSRGSILTGGVELAASTDNLPAGSFITWAVRPEDIELDSGGVYEGTVLDSVALGAVQEITVEIGKLELTVRTARPRRALPGSGCRLDLPAEAIKLWLGPEGALSSDTGRPESSETRSARR